MDLYWFSSINLLLLGIWLKQTKKKYFFRKRKLASERRVNSAYRNLPTVIEVLGVIARSNLIPWGKSAKVLSFPTRVSD